MNNILKYIILTGVFALTFLPFVLIDSLFFPFITGKGFAFRIIVEIIFAAWIILCFRDASYKPKRTPILLSFAVFLGVIAIANLLGENPAKSFWSNYERMEGWFLLLHVYAFILVAATTLKTEKLWRYFWNTSLGACVLVCSMGVLQLLGLMRINQGDVRLDANIGNATYLAVYLLLHIFIALFLFMRRREKDLFAWTYIGIAFFALVILYHTATRGALLGLLGGFFVTAILIALFEKEKQLLRKWATGLIVAALLLVGGFLLLKDSAFVTNSPVLSRFNPETLQSTASTRFMVWSTAIEGFKERPFFGWGQENFNYVFNNNYNPKMFGEEQWFDRTHNVIFDWLIAGGLLGLVSYLSILVATLWTIWKRVDFSSTDKSILTGLIAAYFFQNLFVFDNILSYFLFASVLAYVYIPRSEDEVVVSDQSAAEPPVSYGVVVPVAIGLLAALYVVNVNPLFANKALIKGFVAVQQNKLDEGYAYFEKALAYDSYGMIEIREQIAQVGTSVASIPSVSAETKSKFLAFGKKVLEDQIKETPRDIRHYVLLGSYLNSLGDFTNARLVLNEAVKLSPSKQVIYFELATSYLNDKQYDKAFENFKKAHDLAPEFNEIKVIYALGAVYAGEDEVYEEQVALVGKARFINDNRFITAFEALGKYDKIIEILKERVALDPTNYAHHFSLAATYIAMNRRTDAVRELEEAIKLNASIKEQAEFYISEIKAGRNP